MSGRRALWALRWAFALFIAWSGGQTLVEAHAGRLAHHGGAWVLAIAGVEVAAALAFLVDAVQWVSLAALLAVFGVAGVVSLLSGEAPARFLFYAVAAVCITTLSRADAKPDVLRGGGHQGR